MSLLLDLAAPTLPAALTLHAMRKITRRLQAIEAYAIQKALATGIEAFHNKAKDDIAKKIATAHALMAAQWHQRCDQNRAKLAFPELHRDTKALGCDLVMNSDEFRTTIAKYTRVEAIKAAAPWTPPEISMFLHCLYVLRR
jgi:hypothetical protein